MVGYGCGKVGYAAGTLLLFSPSTFWILENAFIEPTMLVLLTAAIMFARRRPLLAAAAVGLLLVSKQYLVLAIPAVVLVWPAEARARRRWVTTAVAAAAAVTLPFVVWGLRAFVRSLTEPFAGFVRDDSISILPWLIHNVGIRPTLTIPALAAVPVAALVLLAARRTPTAFAAGLAGILVSVFVVATQSFANYYWLAAAAATLAAAVAFQPAGTTSTFLTCRDRAVSVGPRQTASFCRLALQLVYNRLVNPLPAHRPLGYATPFDDWLDAGERVLWSGQPRQGLYLRSSDWGMIPFSLLWGGFAIFWEATVVFSMWHAKGGPGPLRYLFPLWGVPFVLIGLYMMVGRFFVDSWTRKSTWYGVTGRRALIFNGRTNRRLTSFDLASIGQVEFITHGDGTGTITFGPTPLSSNTGRSFAGWPGVTGNGFDHVSPDAYREVRLVQSQDSKRR